MCRKNLWTLSWLGVLAGLALYFVGCQSPQVSHAPVAFWQQRDLEEIKAQFEARLSPSDPATITGVPLDRELRFRNVKQNEYHMFEVLNAMRKHLEGVVKSKGGEIVGPVKEVKEGGPILRSFEFDYRRGKTTGIVRCEVRRTHMHPMHFDLVCQVTEHHPRPL